MPTINYDLDFNIKKEVFTDFQIQNKLVVESNFDFETTYELIICQDDKFPIDFSITNIEDSQANIEKDHMIEWEDQDNETTSVEKYQIYLGFNEETIELVGETSNLFYLISGNLNTDYICYIRQITYCGYKDTPAIRYKTQKYDVSPDISLISPELDSLTHSSIILMWSQQRQEYFKIYFSQVSSITEDDLIEDNYTEYTKEIDNLIQNQYYYWKIIQINDIGQTESVTSYFRVERYTEYPSNLVLLEPKFNEFNVPWDVQFKWQQVNQEKYDVIIYKNIYTEDCETFERQEIHIQQNITNTNFYLQNTLIFKKDQCFINDATKPTHSWKVIQKNNKGSIESQIFDFRLKECNSQPSNPLFVSPIDNESILLLNDIQIKWLASTNTYQIDILFGESQTNLIPLYQNIQNTDSYTISKDDLKLHTTYYIKLIQKNECGEQESNTLMFSTSSCTEIPQIPVLFLPENGIYNVQTENVLLKWQQIENQTHYYLYFGTTPQLTDEHKIQSMITTNNHTLTDLEINTVYYWKVMQINECGVSQFSQIYYFKTQNCIYPPNPFNLLSPNDLLINAPNSITLSWEQAIGQDYYDVYIKKINFVKFQSVVSNLPSNSFQLNNLEQDTIYEWYIIQKNYCGQTKSNQTNKFQTTFSTDCMIPIAPKNPYPQNNSINIDPESIQLRWQKSLGKEPITYTIYLSEYKNPSTILEMKEYIKQDMKMYCKYSEEGIEEEITEEKNLIFSSYDVQNDEDLLYLFPLIQPRRDYSLSCERYVYFKQDNLDITGKITNLKLYLDQNNSYTKDIEMYSMNKVVYSTPTRNKIIDYKMKTLQNLPLSNNILVNGSYNESLIYSNNVTDYCVLQLKILPSIYHHNKKFGSICLQYDEYITKNSLELDYGKTYYWKVVQENECGKVESEIWNFTTKQV